MYPEDQELQRVTDERANLEMAQSKLYGDASAADERIEKIQSQLPIVLFDAAVYGKPLTAALDLRRQLEDLRFTKEIPNLVESIFKRRFAQLDLDFRACQRRQKRRAEYEALKEKVRQNPRALDEFKERDLRLACEYVEGDGNTKDADEFIKKIRSKLAA